MMTEPMLLLVTATIARLSYSYVMWMIHERKNMKHGSIHNSTYPGICAGHKEEETELTEEESEAVRLLAEVQAPGLFGEYIRQNIKGNRKRLLEDLKEQAVSASDSLRRAIGDKCFRAIENLI